MNTTLILLAATLAASSLQAQIQIPPPDLQLGDQYRILFVTEAQRDATSTDIGDYNAFVATDAGQSPALSGINTQWRAVCCTATVNAIQNTGTGQPPGGGNGVPIYLVSGQRVFDNYDALWSQNPLVPPEVTSSGLVSATDLVWTGCTANGTPQGPSNPFAPLGSGSVHLGRPATASSDWMDAALGNGTNVLLPMYGMSDVLTVQVPSTVDDLGRGCSTSRSFLFTPAGADSYSVADAGPNQFDPVIGVLAGATSDDIITAINLDLGFAFPFPTNSGTAPEQFVRIDPNGRILPNSSGAFLGVPEPSSNLIRFFYAGHPMICPFWTDWNVEESNSDGIYWKTEPGKAVFTWNNVAQFSQLSQDAPLMTMQCTLFANGEVLVVLEDIQGHNQLAFTETDNALVGISSGNVSSPSVALDLSTLAGGPAQVGTPPFELFLVGQLDLAAELPVLASLTSPVLGTSFDFEIRQAPSSGALGLYLVGANLQPAPIPLSVAGFAQPCSVAVDFVDIQATLPGAAAGTFLPGSISIPATPLSLLGFELYVQGATAGPDLAATVTMTNTLRGAVGTQ